MLHLLLALALHHLRLLLAVVDVVVSSGRLTAARVATRSAVVAAAASWRLHGVRGGGGSETPRGALSGPAKRGHRPPCQNTATAEPPQFLY